MVVTEDSELTRVIATHPMIDQHAHNILLPTHISSQSFLSVTSEAQGEALETSQWSLSNARARKQLKTLYGCAEHDWNSILLARGLAMRDNRDELYDKCFKGTHTILMDDGLDSDTVNHYSWHDKHCIGRTRRIVRIEAVAESILQQQLMPKYKQQHTIEDLKDMKLVEKYLENLGHTFHDSIRDYTRDKDVAGFKSVICYRSGLSINIEEHSEQQIDELVAAFSSWFRRCLRRESSKVDSKILNDWLVSICMYILAGTANTGHVKPIQFHTGLGDNDINLNLANPAHMQSLIEKFPGVPTVLLHSSYPFTREAGYLASTYGNVFLDLGLAFPMLSRSGQESVLRQALELVPTRKLLWSTDGHWFPETYWLANTQFREALTKVLLESVQEGDLTLQEGIEAAKDILFSNSNHLYKLGIRLSHVHSSSSTAAAANPLTMEANKTSMPDTEDGSDGAMLLRKFRDANPNLSLCYVQWLDLLGQIRLRILPAEELYSMLESGGGIGISRGNLGTLQNDELTELVNTTGQIYMKPDTHSLRPTHHLDTLRKSLDARERTSATVLASAYDEAGKPLDVDPRLRLQQVQHDLTSQHGLSITIGCEIELTFLRRTDSTSEEPYEPYTSNHAWSTMSPEQWSSLGLLRDIFDGLSTVGVMVQQMHSESSPGQYELILPPLPCLEAIDTLVQVRQVIVQIARLHGLRASLHPSPLKGNGTAQHMHISLSSSSASMPGVEPVSEDVEQSFFLKGILHHLRALCAITLPSAPSYIGVEDDHWTGGTWVAWGTQNRETPLRRIKHGHWEIRCIDGMGSPYLQVLALVAAGFGGLKAAEGGSSGRSEVEECLGNPSKLSDDQRQALGITQKLPQSIEESLACLREDRGLQNVIGNELVRYYLTLKEAEQRMLGEMEEGERHRFLVERY